MDVKSSVDEIRQRFDNDVERFSNLQTGQSATIDAPLALELIAQAASLTTPDARHVLDVGCGAGNYALKLLQYLPNRDVTLVDLSKPMLDRGSSGLLLSPPEPSSPSRPTFEPPRSPTPASISSSPLPSSITSGPMTNGQPSSPAFIGCSAPADPSGSSTSSKAASPRYRK